MCFSASASFIAGGTLSTVGVLALKKANKKSEKPLAAVPLIFGIQQIIEGTLWLAFQYNTIWLKSLMTFLFSLFAYAFWPVYIPFTIRLIEKVVWRKKILSFLLLLGAIVSIYLLYFIVRYPVTSEILYNCISYTGKIPYAQSFFWAYVISGCGSCFISGNKIINILGVLLIFSIIVSYYFYATAFVSVWCFFAALLSFVILFNFNFTSEKM